MLDFTCKADDAIIFSFEEIIKVKVQVLYYKEKP